MILTKELDIKIKNNKLKFIYNKKGYVCNINDNIKININDLALGSHEIVEVECDYCGKVFNKKYYSYNKEIKNGKTSCFDCKDLKRKDVIKDKYGVENISQLLEIKEKVKLAINEKYGCDYLLQSDEIKEKINKINQEKYSTNWIVESEYFKKLSDATNIKKYGFIYPNKSEIIKNKTRNTNINKYNCTSYLATDEFRDRLKIYYNNKFLEKYKEYNILKIENENIILYCNECKSEFKMCKNIFYSRIGRNSLLCINCNKIKYNISNVEYSLQKFIKDNYTGKIVFNSRTEIKPYEIDIYLSELKIGFEFNGLYWHSEKFKDNLYHQNKSSLCFEKGIRLIHIFENDWNDRTKNLILNILNKKEIKNFKITNDFNKIFVEKFEKYNECDVNLNLIMDDIYAILNLKDFGKYFLITNEINICNELLDNLNKDIFTVVDIGYKDIDKYLKLEFKIIKIFEPTLLENVNYNIYNCGFYLMKKSFNYI